MIAGIITSTPSMASRAMPASSMARLLASSVKPIVLTPCSLPKREVPTPTIAYLPDRFIGEGSRDLGIEGSSRRSSLPPRSLDPLIPRSLVFQSPVSIDCLNAKIRSGESSKTEGSSQPV